MTPVRIPIRNKGAVEWAMVDADDRDFVSRWQWAVSPWGYATRQTSVSMHRELLGLRTGDSRIVHHLNEDPLDNRRENLHLCANAFEHAQFHPTWGGSETQREQRETKVVRELLA